MSKEMEQKVKNLQASLDAAPPEWVVTFGDMMSLLLCFFVLLLSFSNTDKQKYKEVAGSLAKAFGIQRQIKAFESPNGENLIAKNFDMQFLATKTRELLGKETKKEKKAFEKKIKKEIETRFKNIRNKIAVIVGKNNVTIRLMGGATFDSGKATLNPKMIPLLKQIGSALKGGKGEIIICGHTDNRPVRGKYSSNLRLSIARAATVAEFLINRTHIKPSRISTMGFGQFRPIASNDTPEGRRKNRRVEITLSTSAFPGAEKEMKKKVKREMIKKMIIPPIKKTHTYKIVRQPIPK